MGTRAEAPPGQVLARKCSEDGAPETSLARAQALRNMPFLLIFLAKISGVGISSYQATGISLVLGPKERNRAHSKKEQHGLNELQGFQPTLTHRIPPQKPILITEMLSHLIALPLITYQGHKKEDLQLQNMI